MAIKQSKPKEAHAFLTANPAALYLDVRSEPEFAAGHPSGAINIPVMFVKAGQMQLNPDFVEIVEKVLPKNKTLVVGCMAGGRSQRACDMLEDAGFTDLTNVVGGYGGQRDQNGTIVVTGWKDEGLPTDTALGDATYEAQKKKAGL